MCTCVARLQLPIVSFRSDNNFGRALHSGNDECRLMACIKLRLILDSLDPVNRCAKGIEVYRRILESNGPNIFSQL